MELKLKKQDRKPQGAGEKKMREMKKTIQQLKATIKQQRKAMVMQDERIIQLQDEVGDAATVEIARRLARGKRKKLLTCGTCDTQSLEEFVTDLGVREMVVTKCRACGVSDFNKVFRTKKI